MSEYHLHLDPGAVGRYVLLPGDPGRCEKIAGYFDKPEFVGQNREYRVYSGYLLNEKVSVCSTGIGGPSAAIAMEELIHIGADTFLRVGTCGGIAMDVLPGDVVIALSAVRQDGTSFEYAPAGYPATADFHLTTSLYEAARALEIPAHVGVVQAKDSFYGQHDPDSMPVAAHLNELWSAYKRLGVLASEMESAALYCVAAARGVRCGAAFHVVWNQTRRDAGLIDENALDPDRCIRTAIEALRLQIRKDQAK